MPTTLGRILEWLKYIATGILSFLMNICGIGWYQHTTKNSEPELVDEPEPVDEPEDEIDPDSRYNLRSRLKRTSSSNSLEEEEPPE